MAEVQKLGSVKRFGSRYGRKPKKKLAKVESVLRKKQKCPYCNKFQVKRVSTGIWQCKKCNTKFTGKAYSISKKIKKSVELETSPQKEENQDG